MTRNKKRLVRSSTSFFVLLALILGAVVPTLAATQPIRRELARRIIALDPVIDETIGESAQIRYHSPVLQAAHSESTALGAAFLAGLRAGLWPDLDTLRRLPQDERRFEPRWRKEERQRRLAEWRRAVQAVIAFYTPQPV